jgi:hypothetical protein
MSGKPKVWGGTALVTLVALALPVLSIRVCQAESVNPADSQFLVGYLNLKEQRYAACADLMFAAIQGGVSLEDRARLYLSYCQWKLGSKDLAAYHFIKVNESEISGGDAPLYKQLKRTFQKEIDEATGLHTWVSPFGGALFYGSTGTTAAASSAVYSSPPPSGQNGPPPSNNSNSSNNGTSSNAAGYLFGLNMDFILQSWQLTASLQYMSLGEQSSTNSTQLEGLVNLEKTFSPWISARVRGIDLSSTGSSFNSGWVGSAGFNLYPSEAFKLSFDFYNSQYSNTSIGAITLNQLSVLALWKFAHDGTNWFGLEVESESIVPNSSAVGVQYASTGFTVESFYQRTALRLIANLGTVEFSAGGWSGREAFGIRSAGMAVYTTTEEHHYGWMVGMVVYPEPSWGLNLSFLQEGLTVSQLNTTTGCLYGGLFFRI